MKKLTSSLYTAYAKIDRRTIQIALIVLSLTAFVLGAGAPEGDGGIGMRSTSIIFFH